MANFAKSLPRDTGDTAMQEYPPNLVSTARYANGTVTISSVLTLNQNSSMIEVGAVGGSGITIRWIPLTETASVSPFASVISSGAAANFDHFVPPSTFRRFVIPRETIGNAGGQVGSMNGLYQRIAFANAGLGASSVITSEQ